MSLIIRNGRVLDPGSNFDETADVWLDEGKVRAVGKSLSAGGPVEEIDASGRWVIPGLVDLHTVVREPGHEYKEDILSASQAAVAGGFTTVVAMPNTDPAVSNAEIVEFIVRRAHSVGLCRVLPAGTLTYDRKGEVLAPVAEMRRAGAVAITDNRSVENAQIMRSALEYSCDFKMTVISAPMDKHLSNAGHLHEGEVSTRIGIAGIARVAEDAAVARDIMLAEYTGGRLHLTRISTAGAVEMIRSAKKRGVQITADATPHHALLNHTACETFDTSRKVMPPLREESDRLALVSALADGTLDALATDHRPQSSIEKDCAFTEAEHGAIGLQTALPVAMHLWRSGALTLLQALRILTLGPAQALGLRAGRLVEGAPADIAVVDPEAMWTVRESELLSKSTNSPFLGRTFQGRVEATVVGGQIVFRRGADSAITFGRAELGS